MTLGTVLRVRVEGNEHVLPDGRTLYGGGRRVVTVKVLEDFRGLSKPGDEIEVQTGVGGGDCGYDFRVGEQYLIDAYAHEGKLLTGICSRTAPRAAAGVILRELRAQASGNGLPDLSGSVVHYGAGRGDNVQMPQAVPNVPVALTGSDGTIVRSITEGDGVYQVATLSPGEYTVTFQLPEGLRAYTGAGEPLKVKIPAAIGGGAACHADLNAFTAGRLDGRVVNSHGEGIAGFVSVYSHAPTEQPPGFWSAAGFTEDGVFSMGPLEAGTYWLYFEPKTDDKQHWFYPGSRTPSEAVPLTISRKGDGWADVCGGAVSQSAFVVCG